MLMDLYTSSADLVHTNGFAVNPSPLDLTMALGTANRGRRSNHYSFLPHIQLGSLLDIAALSCIQHSRLYVI